jgi:hypothetical protein
VSMSSMVDPTFGSTDTFADIAIPGADRWSMTQSEDWGQTNHRFQGSTSGSTLGGGCSSMYARMNLGEELARSPATMSDAVVKRGGGGVEIDLAKIEEAAMEEIDPGDDMLGGDIGISPRGPAELTQGEISRAVEDQRPATGAATPPGGRTCKLEEVLCAAQTRTL